MDTMSCYCKKCKGKIVSKKTFHRHLVNENNLQNKNNINSKQKAVEETKNENFDIYSNQLLPTSSLPNEPTFLSYDNDDTTATTSHIKNSRVVQSIPSIPILRGSFTDFPDFPEIDARTNSIAVIPLNRRFSV